VTAVLETKMCLRELGALAFVKLSVAIRTVVRVVRLLVTRNALGGTGQMERSGVAARGDAFVTRRARDALVHVGSMLERTLVRRLWLDAEKARAGRHQERQGHRRESAERAHHFDHT
jgi:hypothetical protein